MKKSEAKKISDFNLNNFVQKTIIISDREQGKRLDQILFNRYPNFSRTLWQKRIIKKEVTVNSINTRPSRKMNKNDIVVFLYPAFEEHEVDKKIELLYEDEFLYVVNKPSHLPVHSSSGYEKNNLIDILQEKLNRKLYLAHRLDRETSGVLLLAKDSQTVTYLAKQFSQKKIYKEYYALLQGRLPEKKSADGYMAKAKEHQKFRMQVFLSQKEFQKQKERKDFDPFDFKSASCDFYSVKYFSYIDFDNSFKEVTLAKIILHTGRTHQIRATALAIGYPLLGDKLYGGNPMLMEKFVQDKLTNKDYNFLQFSSTALHCYCLEIMHPQQKKQKRFMAPLPSEINLWLQTHSKK